MKKQDLTQIENLFSLSREPVIGISGGIVTFCNSAMSVTFGRDFTGEKSSDILPEHLLSEESDAFVSSCTILGKSVTANFARIGDLLAVMLKPEAEVKPGAVVPPSLIQALNASAARVKISAELIQNSIDAEGDRKLQEYMSTLFHSYYTLYRLIYNLETINALSLGNLALSQKNWDLVQLCSDLAGTVRGLTEERGLDLRFDCEESNLWARVDYSRIEQAILNILTNSLLHTPPGGTITLRLKKMNDAAMICIDDTGSGIPPGVIAHIFNRYDQSVSLSDLTDGCGFGLNIARGIIALHGGTLMIESQEGKSTSVRIRLPVAHPDDLSVFRHSAEPETGMNVILRELSVVLPRTRYIEKYLDK